MLLQLVLRVFLKREIGLSLDNYLGVLLLKLRRLRAHLVRGDRDFSNTLLVHNELVLRFIFVQIGRVYCHGLFG